MGLALNYILWSGYSYGDLKSEEYLCIAETLITTMTKIGYSCYDLIY